MGLRWVSPSLSPREETPQGAPPAPSPLLWPSQCGGGPSSPPPPQPSLGGVTKHRRGAGCPPSSGGCRVSPQPLLPPLWGRSQPLPRGVRPAPRQGPSQGARVQRQFWFMVSKGGEYFYSVSHRSSGKTMGEGGREAGRQPGRYPLAQGAPRAQPHGPPAREDTGLCPRSITDPRGCGAGHRGDDPQQPKQGSCPPDWGANPDPRGGR